MRSAGKEPSEQDDRAEGQSAAPDENQLEMFEAAPIERAETQSPRMINLGDGDRRERGGRNVTVSDASTLRFLDVNGTDPEELRRLEESIRWLMNEGSVRQRLPRAATLPPVRGLPPVEAHEGRDSLVLNPDSLFAPRAPHRRGASAGKCAGAGRVGEIFACQRYSGACCIFHCQLGAASRHGVTFRYGGCHGLVRGSLGRDGPGSPGSPGSPGTVAFAVFAPAACR